MYGFRSEGLRVKTLPCYSRCTSYFSATKVRVPNPYGFRKCSDCKRIAPGKASTPAGMFLGKRAERFGCWVSPGRQKRELWAIHPFSKGMGAPTGMAPPRTVTQEWLGLFAISPIHYTLQWSRSYATIALRRDYVGVSEAAGL